MTESESKVKAQCYYHFEQGTRVKQQTQNHVEGKASSGSRFVGVAAA